MGKQSRPNRFKGVAEDNSLLANVVDDVEIEMGVQGVYLSFKANMPVG